MSRVKVGADGDILVVATNSLTADKRAGISAGGRNMGAGLDYNAGCQGVQADRLGIRRIAPCLANGSGES